MQGDLGTTGLARPGSRTVIKANQQTSCLFLAAHLSLRLLCLMRFLTNRWPLTKAMFVQMILSEGLGVYGAVVYRVP